MIHFPFSTDQLIDFFILHYYWVFRFIGLAKLAYSHIPQSWPSMFNLTKSWPVICYFRHSEFQSCFTTSSSALVCSSATHLAYALLPTAHWLFSGTLLICSSGQWFFPPSYAYSSPLVSLTVSSQTIISCMSCTQLRCSRSPGFAPSVPLFISEENSNCHWAF